MEILIKSFNRPYYLDRCIYSIKKYSTTKKYTIKILDDGTPKKYLDLIQKKYHDISIAYSPGYNEKALFCEHKNPISDWKIPINFWQTEAAKTSDYFLLLEDDNWFVESFNIEAIETTIRTENTIFLKLLWLGNPKLIAADYYKKDPSMHIYQPNLLIKNPKLYKLIFQRFNRKVFKILFNLIGIDRFAYHLKYYTIYTVAGAVFNRDYFCALWENHNQMVNERLQIYNALQYLKKEKQDRKITFGNTSAEILKTGFVSSATNEFEKHTKSDMDMFSFNKIINEAWYHGRLDTTNDLSKDISSSEIKRILASSDVSFETWQQWTQDFKNHYASFGCQIA
ncbi:hypothetical protein ACWGOQ_0022405 [Aquimarina sp. M1]